MPSSAPFQARVASSGVSTASLSLGAASSSSPMKRISTAGEVAAQALTPGPTSGSGTFSPANHSRQSIAYSAPVHIACCALTPAAVRFLMARAMRSSVTVRPA